MMGEVIGNPHVDEMVKVTMKVPTFVVSKVNDLHGVVASPAPKHPGYVIPETIDVTLYESI